MALESPFGHRVHRVYDLDDDTDLRIVGLSKNQQRADRIIHFVECHHAVVEDKGRAQPVKKGIAQLNNTIENAKLSNIKFAILVKEKIPRGEQGYYSWNHTSMRVTYKQSNWRPVTLARDLPLYMLTPRQAKSYGLE